MIFQGQWHAVQGQQGLARQVLVASPETKLRLGSQRRNIRLLSLGLVTDI